MYLRILCLFAALIGVLFGYAAPPARPNQAAVAPARRIAVRTDVPLDPEFEVTLRQAGFEVVVLPPEESNWEKVSRFNLWLILDWSPEKIDPQTLRRFLDAGGGVFVSIFGSDVVNDKFAAWNALLAPYGAAVRREQVVDREHQWHQPSWGHTYAWTNAFADVPITRGLSAVWYPDHTQNRQGLKLGNSHLIVDQNWQPVVRTMPSGGAYVLLPDGAPDFSRLTQSAPPILAVRPVGAGRLAAQSFPGFYNVSGGSTLMVENIVLEKGDGVRRSDGAQLLLNTFRWLAEPSLASGKLGGWQPEKELPKKPWPGPPVTLDQWEWMRPRVERMDEPIPSRMHHFRGLLGAHTALSNGTGTVAEHCAAARQAGYDFIIFTEQLGSMTPEKYDRLVSECRAASTDRFLALPGLDVQVWPWGNTRTPPWNYLVFGFEKFPDRRYLSEDGTCFARQFDNWYYAQGSPGVAVHSLARRGLPGWFYAFYNCFSLFTYRSGRLVDNSEKEFQRVVDNGACLLPVVTHLCYSAADIQRARQAPFQLYVNVPRRQNEAAADYRAALHSVGSLLQFGRNMVGGFRTPQPSFVSSGPMLEEYAAAGGRPFDLKHLDRIRLVAGVSSPEGLRHISIYDGERSYRRFAARGKQARIAVEDFSRRYWHFVLKAQDAAGGRLISSALVDGSWHIWAQMCTDQQNIIAGPHLYFKGHATLVRFPYTPPNNVRFWAGEGDDGPNLADWNSYLAADVAEKGSLKEVNMYAPPEFHLDLASPFAVIVDANQGWKGERGQIIQGPADPVRLRVRTFDFWPAVPWATGNLGTDFPDYYQPHPPQVNWGLVEGEAFLTRDVSPAPQVAVNLRLLGVSGGTGDTCAYLPAGDAPMVTVQKPPGGWHLEGQLAGRGMLVISPVTTGSFCLYPLTPGMTFSLTGGDEGWQLALGYHLDGPARKGQRFPVRFILARGLPGKTFTQDLHAFQAFANRFGLTTPHPFYYLGAKQGRVVSSRGLLEMEAHNYGFLGNLWGADQVREVVGVRIRGLVPRWDAGVFVPKRRWLRRIAFVENAGYTSLDQTEPQATLYVGNLLVCNNKAVDLRLLGATDRWCRFTVHNSGIRPVTVTVRPAPGFKKVYRIPSFARMVTVPARSTLTMDVGKRPVSRWAHVYDGVDTPSQTGVMMAADAEARAVQVRVARAGAHRPGYLMLDQWSVDEPVGRLRVSFRLKVDKTGGEDEIARLEVMDRARERVLASRSLRGSDFRQPSRYQEFSLPFHRPANGALDYRIYWTGGRTLYMDTVVVRQASR
ncbi:MAG: hypothetical protein HY320_00905 [Armatimonadetes bacterium]|nr:hypothetical protein [Armatimonadota bacterium]